MKKRLITLALILAMALTFGLVACGGPKGEATVYAGVHNLYLGEAKIKVDKDGKVTEIKLDEYFLPHTYATWNAPGWGGDSAAASTHAAYLQQNGTAYIAKFIQVGKAQFELQVDGTTVKTTPQFGLAGPSRSGGKSGGNGADVPVDNLRAVTNVPVYKQTNDEKVPGHTAKIDDLAATLLQNQETAKWYVGELTKKECGFKVLKADKTASGITAEKATSGIKKTDGKYWPKSTTEKPTNYPLGWFGNIEKIEAAFKANPFVNAYAFAVDADKTFKAGTVTTGATAQDFADYYLLCQLAYKTATHA